MSRLAQPARTFFFPFFCLKGISIELALRRSPRQYQVLQQQSWVSKKVVLYQSCPCHACARGMTTDPPADSGPTNHEPERESQGRLPLYRFTRTDSLLQLTYLLLTSLS
jgi:hypothetical protein